MSDEEKEGKTYLEKRAKLVQEYERIKWQLDKLNKNDRKIAEDAEAERWEKLSKEERWKELRDEKYAEFLQESQKEQSRQEVIKESKKAHKIVFEDWDLHA